MTPQVVGSILMGADQFVAEWIAGRIPHMRNRAFGPFTALGIIRDGHLVGGVVYHGYVGHDVQVSFALDRVSFMPWRALFSYPLIDMGCSRITAIVGRKNRK